MVNILQCLWQTLHNIDIQFIYMHLSMPGGYNEPILQYISQTLSTQCRKVIIMYEVYCDWIQLLCLSSTSHKIFAPVYTLTVHDE